MNVFSVIMLCVLAAMLCIILSSYKPEYAMAVVIAAGIFIMLRVLGDVLPAIRSISQLLSSAGIELSYFKVALKALGICYITQFAADICRDFGQTSLASKAELAGKCAVLLLAVPLIESVTEIALSFIFEI